MAELDITGLEDVFSEDLNAPTEGAFLDLTGLEDLNIAPPQDSAKTGILANFAQGAINEATALVDPEGTAKREYADFAQSEDIPDMISQGIGQGVTTTGILLGGTSAGAAIGTAIAPGPGTVVGGVVGGAITGTTLLVQGIRRQLQDAVESGKAQATQEGRTLTPEMEESIRDKAFAGAAFSRSMDIVLSGLTGGFSSPTMTIGKAAVKTGAKSVTKQGFQELVENIGKEAAEQSVKREIAKQSLTRLGKVKQVLKAGAEGFAIEGTGEYVDEVSSRAAVASTLDPGKSFGSALAEEATSKEALQAGFVGGVVGSSMQGVSTAYGQRVKSLEDGLDVMAREEARIVQGKVDPVESSTDTKAAAITRAVTEIEVRDDVAGDTVEIPTDTATTEQLQEAFKDEPHIRVEQTDNGTKVKVLKDVTPPYQQIVKEKLMRLNDVDEEIADIDAQLTKRADTIKRVERRLSSKQRQVEKLERAITEPSPKTLTSGEVQQARGNLEETNVTLVDTLKAANSRSEQVDMLNNDILLREELLSREDVDPKSPETKLAKKELRILKQLRAQVNRGDQNTTPETFEDVRINKLFKEASGILRTQQEQTDTLVDKSVAGNQPVELDPKLEEQLNTRMQEQEELQTRLSELTKGEGAALEFTNLQQRKKDLEYEREGLLQATAQYGKLADFENKSLERAVREQDIQAVRDNVKKYHASPDYAPGFIELFSSQESGPQVDSRGNTLPVNNETIRGRLQSRVPSEQLKVAQEAAISKRNAAISSIDNTATKLEEISTELDTRLDQIAAAKERIANNEKQLANSNQISDERRAQLKNEISTLKKSIKTMERGKSDTPKDKRGVKDFSLKQLENRRILFEESLAKQNEELKRMPDYSNFVAIDDMPKPESTDQQKKYEARQKLIQPKESSDYAKDTSSDKLPAQGLIQSAVEYFKNSKLGQKKVGASRIPLATYLATELDPDRNMPRPIMEAYLEEVLGGKAALLNRMEFNLKEFGAALKIEEENGFVDNGRLKQALAGDVDALHSLPESLRKTVSTMRNHVDELSKALREVGVAQGDLALTFEENKGVYLNRSYQIHDVKQDWISHVESNWGNYNRAIALFRDQFPRIVGESQEDYDSRIKTNIKKFMNDVISDGSVYSAIDKAFGKSTARTDSRARGVLSKRNNIPLEIRELLGERTDAPSTYVQTITKATTLLQMHKFQQKVKDVGLATGLFTVGPDGENVVKFGGAALGPLNEDNLHTTPEFKYSFEKAFNPDNIGSVYKFFEFFSAAAKVNNTVGSTSSQARNFSSNFFLMFQNGAVSTMEDFGKAVEVTLTDLGVLDPGATSRYANEAEGITTRNDLTEKYMRLYLLNGNEASEFNRLLKDLGAANVDSSLRAAIKDHSWISGLYNVGSKVFDFAKNLYRAGDAFWKVMAFETQKRSYQQALGDTLTEQEIDELAARNIIRTQPTYEIAPHLVQRFRAFAPIAPFVSFQSAVIQSTYESVRIAMDESKSSNPKLSALGKRKLAGIVTATLTPGIMAAVANAFGPEDEEYLEAFKDSSTAPWWKHSNLAIIGKTDDGKDIFFNADAINPYAGLGISNVVFSTIKSLSGVSPKSFDEILIGSAHELLNPFFQSDIFYGAVGNAIYNQDHNGGHLYNPEAPASEKLFISIAYILENSLKPRVKDDIDRVVDALLGKNDRIFPLELTRDFGGVSYSVSNNDLAIKSKGFSYKNAVQYENTELGKIFQNRKNTYSDNDYSKAIESYQRNYKRFTEEMIRHVDNFKTMGMSEEDIIVNLKEAGLTNIEIGSLLAGKTPPKHISISLLKKLEKNPEQKEELEKALGYPVSEVILQDAE